MRQEASVFSAQAFYRKAREIKRKKGHAKVKNSHSYARTFSIYASAQIHIERRMYTGISMVKTFNLDAKGIFTVSKDKLNKIRFFFSFNSSSQRNKREKENAPVARRFHSLFFSFFFASSANASASAACPLSQPFFCLPNDAYMNFDVGTCSSEKASPKEEDTIMERPQHLFIYIYLIGRQKQREVKKKETALLLQPQEDTAGSTCNCIGQYCSKKKKLPVKDKYVQIYIDRDTPSHPSRRSLHHFRSSNPRSNHFETTRGRGKRKAATVPSASARTAVHLQIPTRHRQSNSFFCICRSNIKLAAAMS